MKLNAAITTVGFKILILILNTAIAKRENEQI